MEKLDPTHESFAFHMSAACVCAELIHRGFASELPGVTQVHMQKRFRDLEAIRVDLGLDRLYKRRGDEGYLEAS